MISARLQASVVTDTENDAKPPEQSDVTDVTARARIGEPRSNRFAEAVSQAVRRARAGAKLENAATELRLRAERRAGGASLS